MSEDRQWQGIDRSRGSLPRFRVHAPRSSWGGEACGHKIAKANYRDLFDPCNSRRRFGLGYSLRNQGRKGSARRPGSMTFATCSFTPPAALCRITRIDLEKSSEGPDRGENAGDDTD